MCLTSLAGLFGGSKKQAPAPKPVAEAPTQETVDSRKLIKKRKGSGGNVFSDVLGGSDFGDNVVTATKLGSTS